MNELRHYCSACLSSLVGHEARCHRPGCERERPAGGWPRYLVSGEVVGERYSVRARLGAGGAGVTYRAVDLAAGRGEGAVVALKVLHADRVHGVLRARLRLEGQVLRRLEHPHIVAFHDLWVDGAPPYYLATGWVAGGTLDRRLRHDGPLAARDALELGRQVAAALAHAHASGVVHRDLKPANVLLEPGRRLHALVADFGVARAPRGAEYAPPQPLTVLGGFVGTPEYAAPEQLRGDADVGPAADLFALGILLHDAAGGTPMRAEVRRGRLDPARLRAEAGNLGRRPLSDLWGGLAEWELLDRLVDRLLAPDAADRPSAREVEAACADALRPADTPLPTFVAFDDVDQTVDPFEAPAEPPAPAPRALPAPVSGPAGAVPPAPPALPALVRPSPVAVRARGAGESPVPTPRAELLLVTPPSSEPVLNLATWRPATLTGEASTAPGPAPGAQGAGALLGWTPTRVGQDDPEPARAKSPRPRRGLARWLALPVALIAALVAVAAVGPLARAGEGSGRPAAMVAAKAARTSLAPAAARAWARLGREARLALDDGRARLNSRLGGTRGARSPFAELSPTRTVPSRVAAAGKRETARKDGPRRGAGRRR